MLRLAIPTWLATLRNGLLAALFAAALITILEYSGFNAEINAEALRLAFSLVSQPLDTDRDASDPAMPSVVLLSQALYETHFNQTSPLQRRKLRELIAALVDTTPAPRQLVIDIDLSPPPAGGGEQQALLDALLSRLANELPDGVTLTTPAPVVTPSAYDSKRRWLARMCAAGVRFGLPYLYAHEGVVLKHPRAPQALANVAWRARAADDATASPSICARVRDAEDELSFLWQRVMPQQAEQFSLISSRFYRTFVPVVVDSPAELQQARRGSAATTLFLGGSYGHDDWYLTPAGEQPGVVLHAAGFYSAHDTVRSPTATGSLLTGVICALAGGYLLLRLKQATAPHWLLAAIAPLALPILLLVVMALLLALFLTWNIVFSVAMVTEGAVLFSEFYPSLRSQQGIGQGRRRTFFDSYVSLLVFLCVVLTAVILIIVNEGA